MKILLEDGYYITEDGSGYILYQNRGKRITGKGEGVDDIKTICYPSTIKSAVNRYAMMVSASKDDEVTLKEYVDRFENVVNNAIKQI